MRKKRLRASTLIETIVAMTLLLLCFGIFLIIYNSILSSGNNRTKLSAVVILDDVAIKAHQANNWIDESMVVGTLKITKTINSYKECSSLRLFELRAFNSHGDIIATRKEIIKVR